MLSLLLLGCATRAPILSVQQPPPAQPPPAQPPPAQPPPAQPPPSDDGYPVAYSPAGPDGQPVPFDQWRGQAVLVNVWASWCPPCIEELPALLALHAEWQPTGLVVVGVAIDDQVPRVLATADARGMAWTQTLDGSNRASLVFDTDELPTTLLYDREGALVYKHVGPLPDPDPALTAAISQALAL